MGIGAIGTKAWGYIQRGAKLAPEFILGTGNEKFSNSLKNSFYGIADNTGKRTGGKHFKNFWTQIKDATKAAEAHNAKQVKLHGGFWKNMLHQTKTLPRKIATGWKVGAKNAAKAGKMKWWGGVKGSIGAMGKRLPLLGGLFAIAIELPNIIGATKEDGLFGGVAEAGKTVTRVTAGMAGGALGAALLSPIPVIGPLVGSLLGYMAGDKLASLITGKSYSEKQMEKEAVQGEIAQAQQHFDTGSTNPFAQQTMTPEQLAYLQQQLYGGGSAVNYNNDFMAQSSGIYNTTGQVLKA